jgi:sugar phosphate isomerase/epimerase
MKLLLIRHLWGVSAPWDLAFPQIKDLGYAGIESRLPAPDRRRNFRRLLSEHGFHYIPQVFTSGLDASAHINSLKSQLEEAVAFSPLLVNAHSGQDSWSEDEAARFFEQALRLEAKFGFRIAHETHRGRVLFNPWTTSRILKRFPELNLCCDFSHWVCVAERLLPDHEESVRLAAAHCLHLHARVGYEQGPQVPDPRAPEYATHLSAHEQWWKWAWKSQQQRRFKVSTLTPEFGPPLYQHTLPFTGVPVSDLWDICNWQARRQAANFARAVRAKN